MKRFYLVALLLFSSSSFACPNVVGAWKSSKELSMAYNESSGGLTEKRRILLNQILGNITITYTKNTWRIYLENRVPVIVDGHHSDFDPFEKNYSYQVVSCGKNSLEIKSIEQGSKKEDAQTLTFESEDTFWVSPDHMPETREYYVRTQK